MKQLKLFALFLAFMALSVAFVSCDDNDDDGQSVELTLDGGCWICAYEGYSEMLTFENGAVTSNGVAGNDTWEKTGSYELVNDKLTMVFDDKIVVGTINVNNANSFTYNVDGKQRNFDRRYPPQFEDIYGWYWDNLTPMLVNYAKKEVYTSPYYESNGEMVADECPVSELLDKIQNGLLEQNLSNIEFTENEVIMFPHAGMGNKYPYTYLGENTLSINFGTAENPCNVIAQLKLFATGRLAMYIVNESCYQLLALNDLNRLGIEATKENIDIWATSYADTFDQLIMIASYTRNNMPAPADFNLVGGCWICAYEGYSEMLTFEEGGVVTTNGVAGNNTWEHTGTFALENDKLTMNFNVQTVEGVVVEKIEGVIKINSVDCFTFDKDGIRKDFDRRYPPQFEDIYGWFWSGISPMLVNSAKKEVYTSPYYESNGEMVADECSVSELLDKIQNGLLEQELSNIEFTENEVIVFTYSGTRNNYPYTYLGENTLSVNFGTAENPCNVIAQFKLFATGRLAMYIVNESCYQLLALNDLNRLGIEATKENIDIWAKSYADTFDQLVMIGSYGLMR